MGLTLRGCTDLPRVLPLVTWPGRFSMPRALPLLFPPSPAQGTVEAGLGWDAPRVNSSSWPVQTAPHQVGFSGQQEGPRAG